MRVRSGDGLNLEVAERGEGPPVMLLHGFGGSSKAWGEAALAGSSLAPCPWRSTAKVW